MMLNRPKVADLIIYVLLNIPTDSFSITGMVETSIEIRMLCDPNMLAPACFNKPVKGIVGIFVTGINSLITEKDCLLCVITDVRNISDRIVCIMKILNLAAGPSNRWRAFTIIWKIMRIADGL